MTNNTESSALTAYLEQKIENTKLPMVAEDVTPYGNEK